MNRDQLRRLATAGVTTAVAGALWLAAPEIYSGTFSDLGTFIRVSALIAGLVAWVLVIRRLISNRPTGALVGIGPVAIVAALVLWPYLRPATEVNEAFPPVGESTAVAPSTSTTAPTPPSTTTVTSTTTAAPTATTTSTTTTTTASPEPLELRRAGFQGLTGHRGSGEAAVYRLPDQSVLLRFEAVDIGPGPDLEVYVVPGEDQRSPTGGFHVAALTAERGNQNYTLPAEVDLSLGNWTVLVWCETFDVEVANATLT